ncbi:MAG: ABC transporter ATP-binding protein [Bifidobacteriaceae bacterium]|nr:ABC transporter ATP-binding protein [Bifidobacteriaceae bacterium]
MNGSNAGKRGKPGRRIAPGTTKRLLKYMMKFKAKFILVAFCIVLVSLAQTESFLFLQKLIDDYIMPLVGQENPSYAGLIRAIIFLLSLYAIAVAARVIYSIVLVTIEQGTLKNIRDDMFRHMQHLPIRYFDTHQHGDVMSRYTNDTDALRQAISQSIPQLLANSVCAVGALAGMFVLNIPLTGFVIVFTIVFLTVLRHLTTSSGRFFVQQQHTLGDVNGFVEESVNGQRVIRVFTHEQASQKDFDKKNEAWYEASSKANIYGNVIMPVTGNMGYLLYVLIAIFGAWIYISGNATLTVGALISFLSLSRNFINPIGIISQQMPMVIMALAGASRIFELIDEQVEDDEGTVTLVKPTNGSPLMWKVPSDVKFDSQIAKKAAGGEISHASDGSALIPVRGNIRFDNVNFAYNPDNPILHDITLFAKPGQKVALVGTTGAGKTTITNLINRFYDISDGSILYDGINISDISKKDLRQSMGIVLQDVNLFTGTVMENIRYGRLEATDEECIAAAKLAHADSFIRMLENGYDTVIDGDDAELSQGQRQLISIARAAVADPAVMILDEATSSIDTRTEEIVQRGMDALMEGRTVFVIAHRLSTIRNSDVIMVMDHGRIIERGNHEELMEERGRYYQLNTGAFELD